MSKCQEMKMSLKPKQWWNIWELFRKTKFPNTYARKTNQEYVRTSPKTKENILAAVKPTQTVRDIFKENFNSDDPPRDTKMIHNIKKKLQRENNPGYRQNNADDIEAILNLMADENPFVREIVQLAGKPPNTSVILINSLNL